MADNVTLKWPRKDAFFRRLVSVVPAAEQELAAANEQSANALADLARRLAATGDSGRLQASIRIETRERGSLAVLAGGPLTTHPVRKGASRSYDYAFAAEFGTEKMPAQPFFWPSFRVNKRPAKARATRALTKAIKQRGFGTNG